MKTTNRRITHTADSLRLTEFALKLSGWHSYAKDKRTLRAVERAKFLGAIETSKFNQFRPLR